MIIPPVRIEAFGDFRIVRDDLLAGGTKRRALVEWLPTLKKNRFSYVGSVYGSGGWALAEACLNLDYGCTLYIPKSKYEPDWLKSVSQNISVIRTAPQPVDQLYGSLKDPDLLPLGFNHDDFKAALVSVFKDIKIEFSEIWMPCVSGVMVQAASQAWPRKPINAVCVAKHHGDTGFAKKYQALEKYHQCALYPPPFPANRFSDAKLWSFASRFALKGALLWNTSS